MLSIKVLNRIADKLIFIQTEPILQIKANQPKNVNFAISMQKRWKQNPINTPRKVSLELVLLMKVVHGVLLRGKNFSNIYSFRVDVFSQH